MNRVITLLITATITLGQYVPGNEDGILPYSPPGFVPPMPPTDPPGYEAELTHDTTTSSQGLRPPPLPSWTHQISLESSGQQSKVEETDVSSGEEKTKESHVEGSGEVDGSGSGDEVSGSGDGSGEFFADEDASGEGSEDDFGDIMKGMDREAEVLGIHCPTDVIFVIDATSSVRGIFEEYINYLEKVIEGLDIAPAVDHVGAIVYSSEKKQRVKIQLGEHKDMGSLMKAVDELPFFSGITATGQALKYAAHHTEGRRENLTLNFVVLTDGYSYDLIESGASSLRAVPNSTIYAVSIGDVFLKKELDMITGNSDNVLSGAMSYGTLVKRLKFCSARAKARFQHDANVENVLVHPGEFMSDNFKQRTSSDAIEKTEIDEDFPIKNAEEVPAKDCLYDIGIIFDSSGSLMQNFQRQLSFANQLVEQMPVAENQTRVGIIQFAGKTKTRVLADFSQNKTKAELKTIIDRSPFYSGTTFTNQALKKMAKMFEDSSRDGSKCKLVVFTDGYSAEDTAQGIEALKSRGVAIFTVGISTDKTTGLNIQELKGMATSPEHYYDSTEFSNLLQRFPSTQYCE